MEGQLDVDPQRSGNDMGSLTNSSAWLSFVESLPLSFFVAELVMFSFSPSDILLISSSTASTKCSLRIDDYLYTFTLFP